MSVPKILGLRNVKVPVTDLRIALDWYGRVFGFRPTIEFPDADGVVRGVHGELPGIGDVLALREDPAAARGLGVSAIANFAVADRVALEAWNTHLDETGRHPWPDHRHSPPLSAGAYEPGWPGDPPVHANPRLTRSQFTGAGGTRNRPITGSSQKDSALATAIATPSMFSGAS